MYLTSTDVIRLRADAAATTTESLWYTASKIKNSSGGLGDLVPVRGVTTGTSNVSIVTSPSSGTQKECVRIVVTNMDSVNRTFTVEFYDGSNAGPPEKFTLAPSERAEYQRGMWRLYDTSGVQK